jgi:ubiquinone/menaquinone biosynthesis C-methylase UbiE
MASMLKEELEVVIDEFLRLTKPGGRVLISPIEYSYDEFGYHFAPLREILEELQAKGIIQWEVERSDYKAETPPSSLVTTGHTWYTLKIKKLKSYSPSPFPKEILP